MAEIMRGGRVTFGRQSSLAPDDKQVPNDAGPLKSAKDLETVAELLYCACKGDVEGVDALLAKGLSADATDFDRRTALHLAACEGHLDVVQFLINKGADVNRADRWGSTPLADAKHYNNVEVCKLLEKNGARLKISSMRVASKHDIPEYEIIPDKLMWKETKFKLPEGSKYKVATWHGTKVAVKVLSSVDFSDESFVQFRDELDLLQRLRHPNVVQFLGAVTQSTPMMIVTEFLPQMDLGTYLKEKGRLDAERTLSYALDIARGMNYLHELKPDSIIHRDLKPSNLLRDAKHLKVADFGLSLPTTYDSDNAVSGNIGSGRSNGSAHLKPKGTSCRYMAPELYQNDNYDKSVDVFSFSLIVQEMMEGCPPFHFQAPEAAAKEFAADRRPPFRHHGRRYPSGLKDLIEKCWHRNPAERPNFEHIINDLIKIQRDLAGKNWLRSLSCLHQPLDK